MSKRMTDEQSTRLAEARARQEEARERIKSLAASSITSWIMSYLAPLVGRAVRAVVDWFAKLFR